MELLYVYIDKYRCFKEQEIIFSNKFNVEFNKSNISSLTLKKEKSFITLVKSKFIKDF